MKLATALSERADLQKKISELSVRLKNNAKVQDGEQPSEKPEELMTELDGALNRLEDLIRRINRTNNETRRGEETITDLIARRDCLKQRIRILRDFLDTASEKVSRYSKSEILVHSTVAVADIQKQVDAFSKKLRETDELIQELNWLTELL